MLKAAIAHLWFVTIHPFDDGNGRIARAIADMALAQSENRTAFDERIRQIYSDHSAKGILRSAATVTVALRAIQDSGEAMLAASLDEVGSVAKGAEAFAMLHTNLEGHLQYLELKLDDVLRLTGAAKNGIVMSAASRDAKLSFSTICSTLTRQIEIHGVTFQPARPRKAKCHHSRKQPPCPKTGAEDPFSSLKGLRFPESGRARSYPRADICPVITK